MNRIEGSEVIFVKIEIEVILNRIEGSEAIFVIIEIQVFFIGLRVLKSYSLKLK